MDQTTERGRPDDLSVRIIESLPEPTRTTFRKLLEEPLLEVDALTKRVKTYAASVGSHVGRVEVVDLWTAGLVERKCLALIAKIDGSASAERPFIQAAVLYFISEEDAEDDIDSPFGFEDDLAVADTVARELGFDDIANMEGA